MTKGISQSLLVLTYHKDDTELFIIYFDQLCYKPPNLLFDNTAVNLSRFHRGGGVLGGGLGRIGWGTLIALYRVHSEQEHYRSMSFRGTE